MSKWWTAATLALVTALALTALQHGQEKRLPAIRTRTEKQRAVRRQQKDARLTKRKNARATAREAEEERMTAEQKREQIERIKMQRVEQYQKLDASMLGSVRVVVDLAFAEHQTPRECHSVLKQLGCVYGYMKKCPLDSLISLRIASFSGKIASLAEQHGVQSWKVHHHEDPVDAVYSPHDIVYLSPDATDVLTHTDPQCVYVVGGIVDRSVRKGETLTKASAQNVRVQRLPLREYMHVHKSVLNIDSVIIALNEYANHRDWARAFAIAVPKRMATRKDLHNS